MQPIFVFHAILKFTQPILSQTAIIVHSFVTLVDGDQLIFNVTITKSSCVVVVTLANMMLLVNIEKESLIVTWVAHHRKRVINSYMGCPSARDLGVLWGFDLNPFVDGTIILNPIFGSMSSASTNTSTTGLESIVQMKEIYGGMQAFSILQQLVDLLKVQTFEVDHISYVIRCQEHKVENDQFSQQIVGGHSSNPHDVSLDPCSSIFDHLESETNETEHQGDSFRQCKSPIPSGQLWSHNMQDLGVCEEPSCLEDLNMPDIDLTFRNFEEVFRIEQEPTKVDHVKAEISPKKASYTSQIMAFSHSSLTAESSGTICIDSGKSPSCVLIEHNEPLKWMDSKQGQYGYRKARSDTRKRTKSQNWKFESHESVARSC